VSTERTAHGGGAPLDPEIRAFLEERPRVAMLATTRKDGRPWLQPLWYALDGDEVVIVLLERSVAARAIRRTGHATLCVDDETLPYRFVTLECTARTSDSVDALRAWAGVMVSRYRPQIDAEREVQRYVEDGVVLARLGVERVTYMPQVVDLQDAERVERRDG